MLQTTGLPKFIHLKGGCVSLSKKWRSCPVGWEFVCVWLSSFSPTCYLQAWGHYRTNKSWSFREQYLCQMLYMWFTSLWVTASKLRKSWLQPTLSVSSLSQQSLTCPTFEGAVYRVQTLVWTFRYIIVLDHSEDREWKQLSRTSSKSHQVSGWFQLRINHLAWPSFRIS